MDTSQQGVEWQLRRLEMLRRVFGNRIVGAAGLQRGRLPILEYVQSHQGVSQREIADVLHISPASVTVTVRRMEQDGLVTREQDTDDLRIVRIYVTEHGKQMAQQCLKQFIANDEKMLEGFSDQELGLLEAAFERMFQNLAGTEYADFSVPSPDLMLEFTKEEPDA